MSNKEIKVLYVSLPYTGHEKTMTNNIKCLCSWGLKPTALSK